MTSLQIEATCRLHTSPDWKGTKSKKMMAIIANLVPDPKLFHQWIVGCLELRGFSEIHRWPRLCLQSSPNHLRGRFEILRRTCAHSLAINKTLPPLPSWHKSFRTCQTTLHEPNVNQWTSYIVGKLCSFWRTFWAAISFGEGIQVYYLKPTYINHHKAIRIHIHLIPHLSHQMNWGLHCCCNLPTFHDLEKVWKSEWPGPPGQVK